ncbi:FAD-binding oxidoreductase [Mycolicibacterium sp. YH-1]|uniref:NAD(P)/FAD-dependent oxidoreductase n=1 Tax=Mycolicibacterium sp. YH-1 TaxID=2908837 RepID=UPI001F4C1844|nr:FAD-dependent oxidoreductase [Mycolicibacterium sp. YH-1]UNB52921.1 FAD-binding oxidoreductase [Mycolicibacterium sp. YH-1]
MTVFDKAEATIESRRIEAALAEAAPTAYWLDDPTRPAAEPALHGGATADLAVVGGGYSGLWTALLAKERDPGRSVVLLEGCRIGWAASGRNGGFCEASLTHGASNGRARLPHEFDRLQELGRENLDEIANTVRRYAMACDFEDTGLIRVATEPHQADCLREAANADPNLEFLDGAQMRSEVNSPLYLAGARESGATALVNPARLAWELRRVCLELGVVIYEHTQVRSLAADSRAITLTTDEGVVTAQRVALGTNVFPALLKSARKYTIPVYDYALMTNPLSASQLTDLRWSGREGLTDLNNRFHYSRLTTDADGATRILYGGYDAIYTLGGKVEPTRDQRPESFAKLVAHFLATYPQLEGLGFSHKWGGAIDTCSRFFSFFSTGHDSRVAHAAGFTGLGVGATRYGANIMLDLLSGQTTERTTMDFVKKKPIPFPPDPITYIGAQASIFEMARADRNQGKRGFWLKTMDAMGLGFDS